MKDAQKVANTHGYQSARQLGLPNHRLVKLEREFGLTCWVLGQRYFYKPDDVKKALATEAQSQITEQHDTTLKPNPVRRFGSEPTTTTPGVTSSPNEKVSTLADALPRGFVPASQLATTLGVSMMTVGKWCRAGHVTAVQRGKRWFCNPDTPKSRSWINGCEDRRQRMLRLNQCAIEKHMPESA